MTVGGLNVAVIGAAGYAGGELLRLLLRHPSVASVTAVSRSQAGRPLAAVHPALAPLRPGNFSDAAPEAVAAACDATFLALEHGESSRLMEALDGAAAGPLIDLAADFRLADSGEHARWYGEDPAPALRRKFRYGLADVEGAALAGATRIAAPGCFATAAQLALYPLAGAPLAAPPALFAVTGSSGAGTAPRPTTHHPRRDGNLFAYSVGGHRHEGEVLASWKQWGGAGEPRLMTHAGPFVRGIHLTLHARLARPDAAAARFAAAYGERPFIALLDEPPQLAHAAGTNLALIHVAQNEARDEVQVMVAIDNLVKGAAGQAVQCLNLSLGLPETAGLDAPGFAPC